MHIVMSTIETEGPVKITGSHVHCKCGNILETGHNGVVVPTYH